MHGDVEKAKQTKSEVKLNSDDLIFRPFMAYPSFVVTPKYVKYFDDEGVFHIELIETAADKLENIVRRKDGTYYISSNSTKPFWRTRVDLSLGRKALATLKPGDTWENFKAACDDTQYTIHPKLTFIERFVARIEKPIYIREPENLNPKTFDIIKISMNLSNITPDIKQTVKDNLECIIELAVQKIENDKSFQKYGVPVNILRLTNAVITRQLTLDLTFELKEIE